MKRAVASIGALIVLVVAVIVAFGGTNALERAGVDRLVEATLIVEVDSEDGPLRRSPKAIRLPLHWDVEFEGASGRATVAVPFQLAADEPLMPRGLLVERLGAAYEIVLNGETIDAAGDLAGGDRFYAKRPVHLVLPARLLRPGENGLVFRLRTDAGYRAGLSPPLVGPAIAIDALAASEVVWRVGLPIATSVFSLFVGGFCLLLWWQQRDALYFWAGAGEMLWAATVADTVIEQAPLPWPWWGFSLLVLRAAWAWSLYAIGEQVFGKGPILERRAMLVAQWSAPFVAIAMGLLSSTWPLLVWYAVNFPLWFFVIARLARRAWKQPNAERWLVWSAIVLVVAASGRDVVAARLSALSYAESARAKYLAPMVGLALLWIVAKRFRVARQMVLDLNASLTDRLRQQEAELVATFAQLSEVERSRAILAERQRILRDMHDGVGAHLATAVRQLEGDEASRGEVASSLRDSLTQLKLSIDAMGLPPGDVNALLANLRFRLESRIASAGLAMRWEVDALPAWQAPVISGDEAMRHLQFLLLEAISNVLQHARASTLTIEARVRGAAGEGIEICVVDDGIGPGRAGDSIPRSLRDRAQAIGARITVEPVSEDGRGTRVRLGLAGA
jgi:signal transduction histidine kinase